MADLDVLDAAKPFDGQLAALHDLSLDHLIEQAAERVIAETPMTTGESWLVKAAAGQSTNCTKLKRNDGLHVTLIEGRFLCRCRQRERERHHRKPEDLAKGTARC